MMNPLETRIIEVATWILEVNPHFEHNYFRSEQIRPVDKIRVERKFSIASLGAVNQVVKKRREVLKDAGIPLLTLEEALSYGKLVYTCPSDSTLDGGAEFYSQGVVDIWEVPAWDTWITLGNQEFGEFKAYENCVISWIPESIYNLFYSGQEVGLENNMGWITQLPSNSNLVSSATVPIDLKFIDIADKEIIESRLKQINQQVMVEIEAIEPARIIVAQIPPVSFTLWSKIKCWFL